MESPILFPFVQGTNKRPAAPYNEYYTIMDFNEVDMRIYLPKSEYHLLREDESLCLPKCFVI